VSLVRFQTLDEVLARTTMVSGNAVIDLGNGNSVTLIGATSPTSRAADFIFF
jgi:hypothetical protein